MPCDKAGLQFKTLIPKTKKRHACERREPFSENPRPKKSDASSKVYNKIYQKSKIKNL
jgi:hypothetical protein